MAVALSHSCSSFWAPRGELQLACASQSAGPSIFVSLPFKLHACRIASPSSAPLRRILATALVVHMPARTLFFFRGSLHIPCRSHVRFCLSLIYVCALCDHSTCVLPLMHSALTPPLSLPRYRLVILGPSPLEPSSALSVSRQQRPASLILSAFFPSFESRLRLIPVGLCTAASLPREIYRLLCLPSSLFRCY